MRLLHFATLVLHMAGKGNGDGLHSDGISDGFGKARKKKVSQPIGVFSQRKYKQRSSSKKGGNYFSAASLSTVLTCEQSWRPSL